MKMAAAPDHSEKDKEQEAGEIAEAFQSAVKTGGYLRKVKKGQKGLDKLHEKSSGPRAYSGPQRPLVSLVIHRPDGRPGLRRLIWKRICRARQPASSGPHRLLCLRYLS
jgi:hypothetical protein